MRKPSLRVVESKHSATHPYVIEGYRVNGKRRRLFFRTKSDAQAELKRIKIKQRPGGEAGWLSPMPSERKQLKPSKN